jgi:hypothetical protein
MMPCILFVFAFILQFSRKVVSKKLHQDLKARPAAVDLKYLNDRGTVQLASLALRF